MNIEYARFSTIDEINNRKAFIEKQNNDKTLGLKWLSDNNDYVINSHELYLEQYNNTEYLKYTENINIRYNLALIHYGLYKSLLAGNIHKCQCGGNLRIVNGYNFIGCENYKAITKHDTYNQFEKPEKIILEKKEWIVKNDIKPNQQYLSKFKELFNIPNTVKVTDLILFFQNNNIALHNNEISLDKLMAVRNTKAISDKQEEYIKHLLKQKFDNVLYQQQITYKLENEKEKYCIPDYICGSKNNELVLILDLKKSPDNSNVNQLNRYHKLLEYIFRDRNKIIKSYQLFFIVPENIDLLPFRGITLTQLTSIL
jgi:ssDNA-binding Zn-finger/Zn-ribbon topoisomerase 1